MNLNCLEKMNALCVIREDPVRTGLDLTVYLECADIVEAVGHMMEEGCHLEDLSVLHVVEGFLVSYFFGHYTRPGRIALRLLTPGKDPCVPSVSAVYPGADWHEREANDMYGIRFENHPNPVRLLLPSDMDIYPLRKDEAALSPLRVLFSYSPEDMSRKKDAFTLFDPEKDDAGQSEPAAADGGVARKD